MFDYRKALGLLGLALICACGASSPRAGAVPSSNPSAATTPSSAPATRDGVLVGQLDQPPTVIVMKRDGTVIARLPGSGLVDEHAVGAYVVVESGTGKAWTVDATGTIKVVAPSAATFLASDPNSPGLIVDSSTAIVGCVFSNAGCSTDRVDLNTGSVDTLLTVPALSGPAAMQFGPSLTALELSPDAHTVWLRKVSLVAGNAQLAIVGVNLQTGAVASQDLPSALLSEPDLAISRDGKSVAGQEDAGTDSTNLAIGHLHVVTLATKLDSDVEGTAPYVRGWPPPGPPTVVFSPDGQSVAWWGGFNNGDIDPRINVANVAGTGRPLFRLDDHQPDVQMQAVYWLDASTLVVRAQSEQFFVNTTTGATDTSALAGWSPQLGPTGPQTALVGVLRLN
jgi:hypothetical protein